MSKTKTKQTTLAGTILFLIVGLVFAFWGAEYYDFTYSWADQGHKSMLWHTYMGIFASAICGVAGYMIGRAHGGRK